MDRLTEIKRTDCSQQELIDTLINAWEYLFARIPTKEQLAVVWAQHAIETGESTSMYNYNIGCVKKTYANNKYWDTFKTKYFMLDEFGPIYLAFETLQEGAKFYLKFLKHTKFKSAWKAIEAGNPVEFAHLLKEAKFYHSSEEEYVKAEFAQFSKFMHSDCYEKAIAKLKKNSKSRTVTIIESESFFEKMAQFFLRLFKIFF